MTNLSSSNPFVDESCSDSIAKRSMIDSNATSTVTKVTNPSLKEMAIKIPVHFLQTEHEKLPEIDKSLFEVEEPELINIFTKPSLLKNPFAQPCLTNPFNDDFASNACIMLKSTNPFEVLKDDTNLCTGISEDNRISKLDSSEWHELDKIFQKALSSKLR
ncbi:hypothetical protein AVEN_72758-1 [Araneus ventricosus]|uniref:Uncharacterized protein n=1 Tax=Araneus ventricosus TaxID=182803 RepID=A0A4Y2DNP1_ARAVE|nr:hypothetical protein AVEN_72758-1 [Araneus ventricosus]